MSPEKTTKKNISLRAEIPDELSGKRLDQGLALLFSEYSRSRLQEWIQQGMVTLDDQIVGQKHKLKGKEIVEIHAVLEKKNNDCSENIPLTVIYEDEHILVINKAAGLIVHPGAGNASHTLLNALLHHDERLDLLPRAGIVHRLDKDTTGLMVVAKSLEAHTRLVEALQNRSVKRQYQALVRGYITAGGTIQEPIGRHPKQRIRMAVISTGKEAITHYRVLKHFQAFTLLNCQLETGRTHQIRVHMAHIRHPIVGDPVYGGRFALPKGCSEKLAQALQSFKRQALHAWQLGLQHPLTAETMHWQVELPTDFQALLARLEKEQQYHAK